MYLRIKEKIKAIELEQGNFITEGKSLRMEESPNGFEFSVNGYLYDASVPVPKAVTLVIFMDFQTLQKIGRIPEGHEILKHREWWTDYVIVERKGVRK